MSDIICLIASNILSVRHDIQMKKLNRTLDSIRKQNNIVPKVYLSISCVDENSISKITKLENCTILKQNKNLTKFQHYKKILETIKDHNLETCIIFSGSNGIWHSDRTAMFLYHMMKDNKEIVISSIHCSMTDNKSKDVDVSKLKITNNLGFPFKLTDICCKLKHLKKYLEITENKYLNSDFCDLYFSKFIYDSSFKNYNGINYSLLTYIIPKPEFWMYLEDKDDNLK